MISVSPHIVVPDAGEASAWYRRAFGAQEIAAAASAIFAQPATDGGSSDG